jgi:hypothetical protein
MKDQGSHYRHEYTVVLTEEDIKAGKVTIKLDPFRIASVYKMEDFSMKTILKKCLKAGDRGHKDFKTDLLDIINAAERRLEMLYEDRSNGK